MDLIFIALTFLFLCPRGEDYLEIKIDPSSFPISYHGEFHYRSGATKQQLTGIALTEFITKKTCVRWEDVTVDGITVDESTHLRCLTYLFGEKISK